MNSTHYTWWNQKWNIRTWHRLRTHNEVILVQCTVVSAVSHSRFFIILPLCLQKAKRLDIHIPNMYIWDWSQTTDTEWRHKSKISEKLGQCGRKNMLRPYRKIWDWIFVHAVKAIFSLGVPSPCYAMLEWKTNYIYLVQIMRTTNFMKHEILFV